MSGKRFLKDERLMNCPYCGSNQVENVSNAPLNTFWVVCYKCGAAGPDAHSGDNEAIEMWNTRDDYPIDQIRDRLPLYLACKVDSWPSLLRAINRLKTNANKGGSDD